MYLTLFIIVCVYLGIILCTKKRIAITLVGSGLLFMTGMFTHSFEPAEAFKSFPSEIIILIITLTLFTNIFEHMGFINFIAYQFLQLTRRKKALIMIFMSLLVYFVSLFMNNLTVVLFFSSIALYMTLEYDLPVIPLLVSIIIGSNIGGAPLPWADTPAVVLTLYSDFTLVDFLDKLFLPCLVYAIGLAFYTFIWYKRLAPRKRESPFAKKPPVDWKKSRKFLFLFLIYIVAISIGPFVNISIAYISLFFAGILLCLHRKDEMRILNELPILDSIVFFITLFLIGGVLQSSGILSTASEYIIGLSKNNVYFIELSILFVAFLTATFLSAGPAAATLLPICKVLDPLIPCKLVYAALALGILCGSSMLPWSATGGPIMLSQTREFIDKKLRGPEARHIHFAPEKVEEIKKIFSLKSYLAFSIPFSFIMLLLSGIYLVSYIFIAK